MTKRSENNVTEHALEPCRISAANDCTILDASGIISAVTNSPEFARRIVACVNACVGMPTDVLELAGNGAPNVREWFDAWGAQQTVDDDSVSVRLTRDQCQALAHAAHVMAANLRRGNPLVDMQIAMQDLRDVMDRIIHAMQSGAIELDRVRRL